MVELIEANWVLLVAALFIGLLVAWWVFVRSRRTRVELAPGDEAPGTVAPRRNQALIDAPPATAGQAAPEVTARDLERAERIIPPAMPQGLAGAGQAAQAAAAQSEPQPSPAPEPASSLWNEPEILSEPVPTAEPAFAIAPTVESELSAQPAAPAPPAAAEGDDLTRIKGLGPKLAAQLNELGVITLAQIAAWDEAEIDRIDARLGRFQGRIRRDQWPEQARLLAAGDTAAYEDRFGKL